MEYKYLKTLDCFNELQKRVPDLLEDLEEEMRWYEEDATDEEIGECGENLSRFLVCVYGDGGLEEWLDEIAPGEDVLYVAIFNYLGDFSKLLKSYADDLKDRFSQNCSVSLVDGDTLCFRGLTGQNVSDLMEATGADYNYSYNSSEEAWQIEP